VYIQLSLKLDVKASAYPSGAPHCVNLNGRLLALVRLEILTRVKRASLFRAERR
jgi:hypothetical protein